MSDGTFNLPTRAIAPSAPQINRAKVWVNSSGELAATDSNGVTKTASAIFGRNFQEVENEVVVDLSTLVPTTYLTLVTPNLPLGKYRVGYNFSWSYTDINGNAAHIALYDNGVRHNTTDITTETKNIFDIAHVGTFLYLDNTSGIHTLELKFNGDDIADTVSIKNAYIEIWRVA